MVKCTRFCIQCNNILFPKNKKLYCKVCKKEFDISLNSSFNFAVL